MQGKLVPQDSNDEPAEILYKKIKTEKEKLIKEGKIKKRKNLPLIETDEVPFKIPSNWKWVELIDIVNQLRGITYGIVKMEDEPKIGVKVLRCSDVCYRRIITDKVRRVTKEISERYSRTILKGG